MDMTSGMPSRCSSHDNKTDDGTSYRFLNLRDDFGRLKQLLSELTHSEKTGKRDGFEDQIRKLTTNIDSQFDKLLEGQRLSESRMDRMEQLIRQQSQEDHERKVAELKHCLKTERDAREDQERKVAEVMQCLRANQKVVEDLTERLHESNAKVKCLEAKCEQLKRKLQAERCGDLGRGSRQMCAGRYRSVSCDDLQGAGSLDISFSDSCISLLDSEDETGSIAAIPSPSELKEVRSLASIGTNDSAYSESSSVEILQELMHKMEKLLKDSDRFPKSRRPGFNLPIVVQGFCVNIQEQVFIPGACRISQFSRSLGIDDRRLKCLRDELDFKQDLPSLFWAVIHEWNSGCRTEAIRATMLSQLIQACEDCHIHNPLNVKPMPIQDRQIIERNFSYLVEYLIVRPTLLYLRDSQCLSAMMFQYVMEPEPESEKVLRFVDILPVFGKHALEFFLDALKRSQQSFIADNIIASSPERFAEPRVCCSPDGSNENTTPKSKDLVKAKNKQWVALKQKLKKKFTKSRSYNLPQK